METSVKIKIQLFGQASVVCRLCRNCLDQLEKILHVL